MNIHQWQKRYLELAETVNTETSVGLETLDCQLTTLSVDLFESEEKNQKLERRVKEILELRANLNTQVEILNGHLCHLNTGVIHSV
ncbi:hypothetical protein K1X76_07725 [bacterium]|nr:hypothetical protein [bacterium]